jgi:hypothetical protein
MGRTAAILREPDATRLTPGAGNVAEVAGISRDIRAVFIFFIR